MFRSHLHWIVWLLTGLGLAACAPTPQVFYREVERLGLQREVVASQDFSHVIYTHRLPDTAPVLHLYLGGDGLPWTGGGFIAASDPTPRNPLVLRMLAQDPMPSIFVGRPCYQGLAATPPCEPALWTQARYSEAVVDSLRQIIEALAQRYDSRALVLIGYSGGGTLAVLLAQRLDRVRAVVTVAADLDIDAWTRLHGYLPLRDSLNPATRPPLPAHIRQVHFQGAKDRNLPPAHAAVFLRKHPQAEVILRPEYDHVCCWEQDWGRQLQALQLH